MNPTKSSAASMLRVGLYGGSFDPIHNAHLAVASAALSAANLDEVVFIPAAQSPLKASSARACQADRVELLERALAPFDTMRVDLRELERGGKSYTLDTVLSFYDERPSAEYYWILGGDQFALLPKWHEVQQLVEKLRFLVLRRPGEPISPPDLDRLCYEWLDAPEMDHSSSLIRARVADGEPIQDLVPSSVEAFIYEQGLYVR